MVIGILLGVPAAAASYRAYDLVHHACMSTGCKKESGNAPPFLPPPVQRRGPVVFLDGMSMLICSPISHSPPPRMGDLDTPASVGKELDGEEATLALARMLQLEEQEQLQEQIRQMVEAQAQAQPDDDETMALVRRMQQEEEDQFQEHLRETERLQDEQMREAGLVIEGADGGSPSQFSYEQLTALGDTVGTVSRGASDESIGALKTVMFKYCDSSVNPGTKVRRSTHTPSQSLPRSRHSTCVLARSAPSARRISRATTSCVCSRVSTPSMLSALISGCE